ncbi:MAG: MATE family efflux transporter [Lachnospiraceae bacterium]|nr:MATE family efflux transporter [Lachnospiraceae bacterium]
MRKSSTDMTKGNVARQLLLFALPILLGQIFQNLYNSVDAIVVGRGVGKTALAAVSASADITHLIVGFFTGLSTGAGILFARSFGAKDYKKLHDAIHTSVTFYVILGVVMAAVGLVLTPLLLKLVACPDDVFREADAYLRIYFIGILFTAIYNIGAGVLRSVGDSRNPFIYLVIASVVNVIADLVLVVLLKMGVRGAAIATVVSQLLSVVLVFRRLIRAEDVYKLKIRDLKIDRKLLLEILDLGIPAAIQASLIAISNMFVSRYINSFGSDAMAGIGAAKKIDRFVGMVAMSVGQALATFIGQNFGANRLDRAFRSIRVSILFNLVYILALGSVIFSFAGFFVRIFTTDENAIRYGVDMIHIMMPFYFMQSLNQIFANAVRGFGKSRVVMLCSIFGMIGCRQIFLAITMSIKRSVTFVYLGFPFGWMMAALLVMIYFYFAIYRKYHAEARETAALHKDDPDR